MEIQPTLIEFPNAAATVADGINDLGQIVGVFLDQADNLHGFIYEHGRYTPLDYPGAFGAELNGINNSGQIVGDYHDIRAYPTRLFILWAGFFQ